MASVDVKGALDGIQKGRLSLCLRSQGWPSNPVRWVISFMEQREASISIDGSKSTPFQISCALPQGSPVSPILFLLVTESVLRLSPGRLGYADDINLLASAPSLASCANLLQTQLDRTFEWGWENSLTFEIFKTELQYFHRKRGSPMESSLFADGVEIRPNDVTHWLGVFFDRGLKFQNHIKKACERSLAIIRNLKRISLTTRGIRPLSLRQTLQGAAFATIFYGAETWYSNNTPKDFLARIQLRINDAARAALPVYRTTPVPALLSEIGWGLARAWLDQIHDRLTIRTVSADPQHPLCRLAGDTIPPPWSRSKEETLSAIGAVGRAAGAQAFKNWQATPPLDLFVFLDGALIEDRAGAGYPIYRGLTQKVGQGSLPLGSSAEVAGATAGLSAALTNPMAYYTTNVTVCLDNQEAALRLLIDTPTAKNSPRMALFRELTSSWTQRSRSQNTLPGPVNVRWCPGHVGIPGNEIADALAKSACTTQSPILPTSIARAKRDVKARYQSHISAYWQENAPTRYKDLGINFNAKISLELTSLDRRTLGLLIVARTGHGDFADYLRRFHHEDVLLECTCGEEKTLDHFFFCQLGRLWARLDGPRHPPTGIRWILGSKDGALAFGKWVKKTLFR
ncbi:hypothetical protein K3495_g2746 [Podosphaera aphanis]|nr:hypothetical protein K3495_g2746 [Podosphaera aphanis]